MRRLLFTVILSLLAFNAVAKEQPNAIDVTTTRCVETNPSTAGMVDCYTRAEQEWDDELNRIYKALQRALPSKAQDALKVAQREWVLQRDKEFELINAIHAQMDGTMWIPVMLEKRVNVVKMRVVALQDYLSLLKDSHQ